jgi:hypothetical protein
MKYIALLALILGTGLSYGCQCVSGPTIFKKSLQEFVAHVAIIDVDTITYQDGKYERKLVYSQLRVIKQFNDSEQADTIWLLNGDGANCTDMLFPNEVGKEFVISALFSGATEFKHLPPNAGSQIIAISLCVEGILPVQNNIVTGYITKNPLRKKLKKHNRLALKHPKRAERYYEKHFYYGAHKITEQQMSLEKCYRLIEKTLS